MYWLIGVAATFLLAILVGVVAHGRGRQVMDWMVAS